MKHALYKLSIKANLKYKFQINMHLFGTHRSIILIRVIAAVAFSLSIISRAGTSEKGEMKKGHHKEMLNIKDIAVP